MFHVEEGKAWEVSENLGKVNWEDAKIICEEYRGGNFDDWRLPNKEELNWVYESLVKTEKFENNGWYWTSVEVDDENTWGQNFTTGVQCDGLKRILDSVCAVRVFEY